MNIRQKRLWLRTAISFASALLFLITPLHAADIDLSDGITVDSTVDAADNVIDGACDDGAGNCTLRAAIMEANANPGADTITIPAGNYLLTVSGVDELCENTTIYPAGTSCTGDGSEANPYMPVVTADASIGDLDITDDVTITGAGALTTIIGWSLPSATAPAGDTDPYTGDRVFHVQTTTVSLTSVEITGVTLVGGEVGLLPTDASTVGTPNAYDINVVDATPGSVVIWQFRRMGGAIALGAGYSVTKYEETVHGPGGGAGGGIGGGGGSDHGGPFPGGKPGEDDATTIEAVTLSDLIITGNWSGADGGGLYAAAPLTMSNAVVANNVGGANGGGIYNDAEATFHTITLGAIEDPDLLAVNPIAGLDQPNHGENGGGLFDTGAHTTTIVNSAVNNNTAIGGAGIAGRAGITIDIKNSTISGNVAQDVGGGVTTNGTVVLTNVTVVNNLATTDAPGGGGGLNSFGSGVYVMTNTLLAENRIEGMVVRDSNCGCSGGSATCNLGTMNSTGYNLEDANTCGFTLPVDLWNTDPLIATLAFNGGTSETHALMDNSPAVDAGSSAACTSLISEIGNTDQRGTGYPRSLDGDNDGTPVCDIGAFELTPPFLPPVSEESGGCVYNPATKADPLLPVFILLSVLYLLWSYRRNRSQGR